MGFMQIFLLFDFRRSFLLCDLFSASCNPSLMWQRATLLALNRCSWVRPIFPSLTALSYGKIIYPNKQWVLGWFGISEEIIDHMTDCYDQDGDSSTNRVIWQHALRESCSHSRFRVQKLWCSGLIQLAVARCVRSSASRSSSPSFGSVTARVGARA